MFRRRSTIVDALALFAALAVHVSLLEGARLLPPIGDLLGTSRGRGSADMELVEVETTPPDQEPSLSTRAEIHPEAEEPKLKAESTRQASPSRVASRGGEAATSERSLEPSAATPAGRSIDKGAPAPQATPGHASETTAPTPPTADDYDKPSEAPRGVGLSSLLGAPAWTVPGAIAPDVAAPAPTEAPAHVALDPNVANRVIASTLRSRDKKAFVDVPAASVVSGTVATAMRSVSVPHNTHATFEVKLGPGGKVLGARVVSASAGDATQWDAAAKSVAATLAKQNLPLGPEAEKTGVTVRVSVTQKHVLPSGTARVADIKPKCANGFINDIVDAADDKPMAPVDPKVPMFQDEHGRPCIPVGIEGVSDLANVGAQKQIQVESSFQVILPGQVDLPADIHPVNTDAPWIERGKEGPRPTLPQKVRKMMRDKEKKK